MHTLEYRNGYDFGVGIDTVTGNPLGDPVLRSEAEERMNAEGQAVTFYMQQIESSEELNDALSASASVSARYGFFSGSASFDFAQQSSCNKYSMFLLISTVVTNSFRQMRDVKLAPHAIRLWESGDKDAWLQAMGDCYCRGVSTGGVLNVLLRIDTEDEDHKSEISSEVQAGMNAGVAGFNAKAQFSSMVSRVSSMTSVTLSHQQLGGDQDINFEPDKILDHASVFADSVNGNLAKPFSIVGSPYETVTNLPAQPNKFDRRLQKDVIAECGKLRLRYLDMINDIDYVLAKPHQFDWKGQERAKAKELDNKADALREAITDLTRRASACADNQGACEMPTGDDTVRLPPDLLPTRKRKRRGNKRRKGKGRRKNPKLAILSGKALTGAADGRARAMNVQINPMVANAVLLSRNEPSR